MNPNDTQPQAPPGIAGFVFLHELGSGGSGKVYLATPPWGGDAVALKVVPVYTTSQRARVSREIMALSLFDLPGVVHLVAHGEEPNAVWLAMDHIEGGHFPGRDGRVAWEDLRPTFMALLETVIRLHGLGLVHRDLKPQNVIVRPDGRPVVLDFGIVRGDAVGATFTRDGDVVGTLGYLAPEQQEGGRIDGRADVFALGVMLYTALAGRRPWVSDIDAARLAPTPIEQLVPTVPELVARLLRRMLARSPADRPTSAQLYRTLTGEPLAPAQLSPWLGDDAFVTDLVARLAHGDTVEVWGPPRSGRTRVLEEVAARTGGRWAVPGDRPYSSLVPLIGHIREDEPAGEQVTRFLAALPVPLLADDWESLDRWSREALAAALPAGQLRVSDTTHALPIPTIPESALAALFTGPDRILHLATDGARELHRRTAGLAGRVPDQIAAWLRNGSLKEADGRLAFDRATLDRLRAERVRPVPMGRLEVRGDQAEVLDWIWFCGPHAKPDVLAALLGRPLWEVALQVEELVASGAIASGARLVPRSDATTTWSSDHLTHAHRRLANLLPVGSEGRLDSLLAGGMTDAVSEEVLARVERHEGEGQIHGAVALLWAARPHGGLPVARKLIRLLLTLETRQALEQAAFVAKGTPYVSLVDALRDVRTGREPEIPAIEDDPDLAVEALAVRVQAVARWPPERQEPWILSLRDDPRIMNDPEHLARWHTWVGQLRYRQNAFADAARLHEDAANRRRRLGGRLASLLNAGRAWLQAGNLTAAEERAREALALAEDRRLTSFEGQAHLVLRAVANRREETQPDLDLPDLVALLGEPARVPLSCLTEAFIAWRGAHPAAPDLARRAELGFSDTGKAWGALLARALRWSLEREGDPHEIARELIGCPAPDIALDGLGLLAAAGARLRVDPDRLDALIASHERQLSPYPYGALRPADAIRHLRQELS